MSVGKDRNLAETLEEAAADPGRQSPHELSILLRRAALRMRNVGIPMTDPAVHDALASVAAEWKMPKAELVDRILREWLEANAYLPVHDLEELEPEGHA